jgi:hypothetical protein
LAKAPLKRKSSTLRGQIERIRQEPSFDEISEATQSLSQWGDEIRQLDSQIKGVAKSEDPEIFQADFGGKR